jgi:hypothetical protein
MDVLVLIDKLDDLVHNAKPVPLTDQVRVDKEEIYDILDQMRATIPEEIKQARWIVKERQEMLAEAKKEAERIIKDRSAWSARRRSLSKPSALPMTSSRMHARESARFASALRTTRMRFSTRSRSTCRSSSLPSSADASACRVRTSPPKSASTAGPATQCMVFE